MIFTETILKGSYVIEPNVFSDERGWFFRTYCEEEFLAIPNAKKWVQLNHSFTAKKGTIRGMHYQISPFAEIKLVRCIRGEVYDVIVDLRKKSPTFLKSFGIYLNEENKKSIYIPEGFAHGFQAITNYCELQYHHSALYKPNTEGGLRYNDERLSIDWPIKVTLISERDQKHNIITTNFKGL